MKKLVVTLLCGIALFAAGGPRRAPGFCLIDTSGEWRDLADYRGKVVVLEFMKTDCPHCAAFSAVLNGLKLKYPERLAVLAVANPPDNPQTMTAFVKNHKLSYPLLLDQGQVAYSYVRVPALDLPAVYLIDAGGTIRNSWQYSVLTKDVFEGEGLKREVDKLLTGAPAATPAKATPAKTAPAKK